jgi:flagellar basal-body rod modification protein FlgD
MTTVQSGIRVGAPERAPGSPGAPPARKAQGALGKDDFLKLLVAQLKNQDPQSPMNADQMAAQLAQFSSVEQLTNISKTLEDQGKAQSALLNEVAAGAAVGNIGRTITASSDLIELSGSDNETMLVTGNGGPAQLTITDAVSGRELGTRQMGALRSGTTEFNIGQSLKDLPTGVYRVRVSSLDPDATGSWTTAVRGTVTGLSSTGSGLQYAMGALRIPLSAVSEISR